MQIEWPIFLGFLPQTFKSIEAQNCTNRQKKITTTAAKKQKEGISINLNKRAEIRLTVNWFICAISQCKDTDLADFVPAQLVLRAWPSIALSLTLKKSSFISDVSQTEVPYHNTINFMATIDRRAMRSLKFFRDLAALVASVYGVKTKMKLVPLHLILMAVIKTLNEHFIIHRKCFNSYPFAFCVSQWARLVDCIQLAKFNKLLAWRMAQRVELDLDKCWSIIIRYYRNYLISWPCRLGKRKIALMKLFLKLITNLIKCTPHCESCFEVTQSDLKYL